MFDDLYSKVREFSQQRRLEELTKKARGDPMDIGQLKQYWNEWYQEEQEGRTQEDHGLDASGKGKGLTKCKGKAGPRAQVTDSRQHHSSMIRRSGAPRPTAKAKERAEDRCAGIAESKGTHIGFAHSCTRG